MKKKFKNENYCLSIEGGHQRPWRRGFQAGFESWSQIAEGYERNTRMWAKWLQSCLTLRDPVNCSPPGCSVHGILQARRLEWVAITFSRESSRFRDWTQYPALQAYSLLSEPPGKPKILAQFSSVAQSYLILWDPMDCNTAGLPVHHQLLRLIQTHVHWVSDAI